MTNLDFIRFPASYHARDNPVTYYCFTYDNRYLLPELAGQHKLPVDCHSILPSTGELIFIVRERYRYTRSNNSTIFPDINRRIADQWNAHFGITRAQEAAMLSGAIFGWGTPAAKPWNYNQDGSPRLPQAPSKTGRER
jgi:hypothetical protein